MNIVFQVMQQQIPVAPKNPGVKRVTTGKTRVSGFTLIELMIVIAIVAILVALAVPAYRDYTVRAKVTECIAAAAVPKIQISEYKQTVGHWPQSAAEAGIDSLMNALQHDISKYCHLIFYLGSGFSGGGGILSGGSFLIWVNTDAMDAGLSGFQIAPVMSPVEGAGGVDWNLYPWRYAGQ